MSIKRIAVATTTGGYEVVIGSGLLAKAGNYLAQALGSNSSAVLVLYDEVLEAFGYPQRVRAALMAVFPSVHVVAVPSGEGSKSWAQAQRLYSACIDAGLDRDSVIVALGGGMVGDLAGFVAATYMRGVHFVQMPTTLLAHDSSIGGKVAINLPEGKNLIGAFHAPRLVLYDVSTLRSLPVLERANGLAEAVKHGVIADATLYDWIGQHGAALLAGDEELTAQLLARSCQIKVDVVAVDERESGVRAILNFGHTIGHAIEAAQAGRMPHGAAVAIGMVYETRLAVLHGLAQEQTAQHVQDTLSQLSLPTDLPPELQSAQGIDLLIDLMRRDKKAVRRSLSFVLPRAIGSVEVHKDIPEQSVREVLSSH